MSRLSADAKHHILLEYAPHDATRTFATLAARHAIAGGSGTVARWHQRWDGTPLSLQERSRSGRPRVLSSDQVQQHVRAPILAANRDQRAISYTALLPAVRAATGTELTLRSLQRYGKKELQVRAKHTTKRTAAESECNAPCTSLRVLL
jgi:transposase